MEFLILFIVTLVFFLFGVYCGWNEREKYAKRRIEQYLTDTEEESFLIPVTIEKVEGMFYVYNGDDNSFMAQGKDRKDLESALENRFPGKTFVANTSNVKEVGL